MTELSGGGNRREGDDPGGLDSAFREVTGKAGRHPVALGRELARLLVCGTYQPALSELCRVAAAQEGGRWEDFLGDDGARRPAPSLRRSASRRVTPYADDVATMACDRMPLLRILADFLMAALGYDAVDGILAPLGSAATQHEVSGAAQRLARELDGYLAEHLPEAHFQGRFRSLIGFLDERFGPAFDASAIDDAVVFAYWSRDGSGRSDLPGYASVFRDFVRLRQALDLVPRVGPEAAAAAVDAMEEDRRPLTVLESPPASAVQFLDGKQQKRVSRLLESGAEALALPLSLLRCELFADLARAEGEDVACYEARIAALRGIADHIDRALLASVHALARCRSRRSSALLRRLRPELDGGPLDRLFAPDLGDRQNVVVLRRESAADHLLGRIERGEHGNPELAQTMREARAAFSGMLRHGFGDDDLGDPEVEAGYAAGAPALIELRQRIAAFLERLDFLSLPEGDWERQFAADRAVFGARLGGNR